MLRRPADELPRWLLAGALTLAALGGAGCTNPTGDPDLAVVLTTDLRPGVDFDRVGVRLVTEDAATTHAAEAGEDYLTGVTVAELFRAPNDRRFDLELSLDGSFVLGRRVDPTTVRRATVRLDAVCLTVDCPSGRACYAGACVATECIDEAPAFCEAPEP